MINDKPTIAKLASHIYRHTQAYANEVLEKYQLSSGTYPFLLVLHTQEGINQNQISRYLSIDKSMSARAIQKLIQLGYLRKEGDSGDSRAFKLYLTDRGREIVPFVKKKLQCWNQVITQNLNEQELEKVIDILNKVLQNAKKYKDKIQEDI